MVKLSESDLNEIESELDDLEELITYILGHVAVPKNVQNVIVKMLDKIDKVHAIIFKD